MYTPYSVFKNINRMSEGDVKGEGLAALSAGDAPRLSLS
jgi:hypothetical protein